jgi:prevent-host-death family protein
MGGSRGLDGSAISTGIVQNNGLRLEKLRHDTNSCHPQIADYPVNCYYRDNPQRGLPMVTVTAAEFQRQFGRYRDLALKEPVAVTHHGRESLVMLSAEEYKRLKSLDARQAAYPWEMPDDLAEALGRAEPPEFTKQFDREMG